MRGRGFTLVELMVTVAIVAILASFAVPAYQDMLLRAKLAESTTIGEGIVAAVVAYSQNDVESAGACDVPNAGWNPSYPPVKGRRAWVPTADWAALGFEPDGTVFGAYMVQRHPACMTSPPIYQGALVQAYTDLDSDTIMRSMFWYVPFVPGTTPAYSGVGVVTEY